MATPIPLRLNLLLVVFVLSGFAGLIYQSIWSHYLGLFLGHAAYAQALVLAIFMGGMALGAALVARAGQRWRNLIRTYALIEAVIGLLALSFHWVFVGLMHLSYDVFMPLLGYSWLVGSYKWLLAMLLILPQTVLLGMTFPLMSGGIIRRFSTSDGSILGGLYFTNSIGAAIGVLVAAFVLLPYMGLQGAVLVAGAFNLLVAALAWYLGSGGEEARKEEAVSAGSTMPEARRRLLKIVLLATFFSGAASFAYEIVWIRMLSLAVGSTLHAFELMLASFIAGIAFGGLYIRRRADSAADPMRLVGWMQVLMGLAALASLVFYANAFAWVGYLMGALSQTDGGYALFNLGTAFIAVLIMMPAAFFAGTTLPLFTVILLRDGQGEASIGRVYAWNTLGAILGVVAAIHFLIPVLGLKLALIFAALVDMVIGVILLRLHTYDNRGFVGVGIAVGVVFICTALSIAKVPFDPMRLSSGVYRSGVAQLSDDDKIIYYRDGKATSVSTIVNTSSGNIRISTNGKVDASIALAENAAPTGDEPTMVLAAALPLAYVTEPRSVGVIGFGSGLSTHTALGDPRVERVDTVEIEREIIRGAQYFGERVQRAYEDPRSHIIIDDAKSFFSSRQEKYDFILSEPSNPWISGVGNLFSKEFYRLVPKFLSDDGVFVQWLQLYEIDEELVGSVLNALVPAFTDYHAYLSNNSDLIIIASPNRPLQEPDFDALFTRPLRADLEKVGITDVSQIHFRKVADARLLRALAKRFPRYTNSDYFPVLSLNAPRTRYRKMSAGNISQLPNAGVPVLEALGISSPLPAEVSTGVLGHYARADVAEKARDIKISLKTDVEVEGLYPDAVEFALNLKVVSACYEGAWSRQHEDIFIHSLLHLAMSTLAFLSVEEQEGILIAPAWLQCDKPVSAGVHEVLRILEVLALRDHTQAEVLIKAWFDTQADRHEMYEIFDPLFFVNLQLALIGQGKISEVAPSEQTYGAQVKNTTQFMFIRSLLLAWADVD